MPQEAREHHLVNVARQRRGRGVGEDGIGADGDRRLDARAAALLRIAKVLRAVLVDVPVHPRRAAVIFLQAIHADVALARRGVLRKDKRQCHEGAAVVRPAFQDGDVVEARILGLDHLLTGRIFHIFREINRLARHRDERHEIHLVLEGDMRDFEQLGQLIRHVVEFFHAKRERHALVAAERVHEDGHGRALDVLKEEGDVFLPLQFRYAVGNLGDLELRVDLRRDASQEAALFEHVDEFA